MIVRCPKRDTILIRDAEPSEFETMDMEVRCPSCTAHFHRVYELEWSDA